MTETKTGTKETMEVLALVGVIAKEIYTEIRGDGLEWTDLVKIALSDDFQRNLGEAIKGMERVDDELRDLDATEGLEIAEYVIKIAKEVIARAA